MISEMKKHLPEMETMLNAVFAGHFPIILVGKAKFQHVLHLVNLPLEGLASISKA
jgi:hypothetical protein